MVLMVIRYSLVGGSVVVHGGHVVSSSLKGERLIMFNYVYLVVCATLLNY